MRHTTLISSVNVPHGRPQRRISAIHDLATHPRPYVTPAEIRRYFAVDRRTVVKWIQMEQFPVHILAGVVRVRTVDLLEFERRSLLVTRAQSQQT